MICKNCQKERAKGSHYGFHYGYVDQENNKAEKVVTGSDQVWICRICVARRIFLTWIVGALLFIGLILKLQDDYLISQIQFFITPRIRQVFGVEIGFPLARFAYDAIPVIMITAITRLKALTLIQLTGIHSLVNV